jgi:hypothetical protein
VPEEEVKEKFLSVRFWPKIASRQSFMSVRLRVSRPEIAFIGGRERPINNA